MPRPAHAADAALKKRYKQLKKENAQLKSDLAKAQADQQASFNTATSAENVAGLKFRSATAVSDPGIPDAYPPAGVAYIVLRVRHADFTMTPSAFSAARMVGPRRVQSATMTFQKRLH